MRSKCGADGPKWDLNGTEPPSSNWQQSITMRPQTFTNRAPPPGDLGPDGISAEFSMLFLSSAGKISQTLH